MTNSTLDRPSPKSQRINAPAPEPSRTKPQVTVRAKLVSYPQTRRHARAHRLETAVFQMLMFLFITITAYGVSSIAGQVAVEKSRREELSAKERSRSMQQMQASLKAELIDLQRPDRIDEWARANQFENPGGPILPQQVPTPRQWVALRD